MSTEKPVISVIIPHRTSETIDATLLALESAARHARESGHPEAARYEVLKDLVDCWSPEADEEMAPVLARLNDELAATAVPN